MKILLVKLDRETFRQYHSKGQGGSVMSPIIKESLDGFVERMKLMGYGAFILPECTVEYIGPQPADTDDDSILVPVITIDIGNMSPQSARSHIEQVRDALKDNPHFSGKTVYLTRNAEGQGPKIEMLKI